MRLRMATTNAHKLREVQEILNPVEVLGIENIEGFDVVEDGNSFHANALKKALALRALTRTASFADDSGLEVDALDGRPGIYSARYAGRSGPQADEANMRKLLQELEGVPSEKRTARYVCVIAFVPFSGTRPDEDDGPIFFRETLEGRILERKLGQGGFGYDPVFYLPEQGKSVAELSSSEKHQISHRGKAVRAMRDKILNQTA